VVRVRGWLAEAWNLVGADLPLFSLAAFLTITLSLLSAFILTCPLAVGLCLMFLEKMQGRPPRLSHLWEGATGHFPAALVIWMIFMAAAIPFDLTNFLLQGQPAPWPHLGVLVVLAGVWIVGAPLFFTLPLIADRDVGGAEAVKLSWALVRPRRLSILACTVVYGLTLLFGVFACGLGIIITLPLVVGALVVAYRDLSGNLPQAPMTSLRQNAASEVEEHEED
jgi:uncharacterized membrane protein